MDAMARSKQTDTDELEFFARCAAGFEALLADELRALRLRRVRPLKGGVAFFGTVADAYRACLWSRIATRIQLVLARLDARDGDALYAGCVRYPWETCIASGATIAVQAHGTNDALRNTQFTALKVKDAVCDRLREQRGERPDVDPRDPDIALDVSLHKSNATIFLNLSGASLHRRGYRADGIQTEAPLKETLAAGILLAAGWPALARRGAAFSDPMCGSGTLAVEAALIAADIAPGILRERWGFQSWLGHDETAWQALLAEARQRAEKGIAACCSSILAGDLEPSAIAIARDNAQRAGVADLIDFAVADAATLGKRLEAACGTVPGQGLVAVNPPYGMRLESKEELPATYAALAAAIAPLGDGWELALISPDTGIDTALGMAAGTAIPCYNGPIKASVRIYDALSAPRTQIEVISLAGTRRTVSVAEKNSEQFAARLRKVAKERAKWARRAGVSCYRIYDADLPDYACSIDLFAGTGADEGTRFLRIEEHPVPGSIDADRAARRFADACAIAPAVLDVDAANAVAIAAGQDDAHAARIASVAEGDLIFEANLGAKHDTGLALDHRATRALVRELAAGSRFLSWGSYAGTVAASAAAGGAASTAIVDPSSSYLNWARRNMEANGFAGKRHHLARELRGNETFDLIYADASALAGTTLEDLAARLSPAGTLVLTSSRRDFRIDDAELAAARLSLEDVTPTTIGHDFERTPKIHRCLLLRRS
jgi:23S rRNA (guanine2445-N2)-methyltransferase / 23S rRNA (guanine2069-N7)-methyltransferase